MCLGLVEPLEPTRETVQALHSMSTRQHRHATTSSLGELPHLAALPFALAAEWGLLRKDLDCPASPWQ